MGRTQGRYALVGYEYAVRFPVHLENHRRYQNNSGSQSSLPIPPCSFSKKLEIEPYAATR